MLKNIAIFCASALVVALPFLLKREDVVSEWREGDPVVVVISPHNEAIRYEFGQAFARWYKEQFGRPARVDWRVIGGTSEIMRYLGAEYTSAFRAWWTQQQQDWPEGGGRMILDRRFKADRPPAVDSPEFARWDVQRAVHSAFRSHDDAEAFGCKIDVFFGGGEYDHSKAHRQGVSVPTWPGGPPVGLFETAEGVTIIPAGLSGERWRGEAFYGAALSTFGICYNMDRLADLGIEHPPARWLDLADPRYARQLGVADPTKSGSISKAFEMIIHQQCTEAVRAAGFSDDAIESYERRIGDARLAPGALPEGVPPSYQAAVEAGWVHGLRLVQLIGANARYFTDSAGRVPVDVSMGNAAAGLAIDFYGRFQAEKSRAPDGTPRMAYLTPKGGSSVSADPISLLRGAPNRETAVRFVEFVLGPEGQKLWNYAPGSPGGPDKFALRRLPIRRDFYPGAGVEGPSGPESHAAHSVDNLNDPDVNPYELAEHFTYRPRWTARHFALHRMLIRAMCLDAGEELRSAWQAIIAAGGPRECERAMWAMQQLPDAPEALTWVSAHDVRKRHDDLELMREWTLFFRNQYREAERLAKRER